MTGSTGFVGKCLMEMLEDSGHDIWHLVRNKKGLKNEVHWDFASDLPEEVPPCDVVIHLAAHVSFGQDLEIAQYDVNTVSTIKLVAYSRDHEAYFIFASMVGIHGSKYAMIDNNTPTNPENHYEVSKYLAEEVIKAYLKSYSILRICGIYGLDGPEHLRLNRAIRNAIHKKNIPVLMGPGQAKRNYICVQDVARWVSYLVNNYEVVSHSTESGIKEILYLAGPEVLTIEDYLKLIVKVILPGTEIVRVDGSESQDLVVKASSAPFFELLTFEQYLASLVSSTKNKVIRAISMTDLKEPELIKTKWGFYQYDRKPTDEELYEYYANKYYQEGLGSYSVSYTDEEIAYFELKAWMVYRKSSQLADIKNGKKLIDIGCGEGWIMDEFYRHGSSVLGFDFSIYGIEKINCHLLPFFEQGNIYELLEEAIQTKFKFDFLILANVIEHVRDPVLLLRDVKKIMHLNSILVVVAPNDFSPLHKHLLREKKISRRFWLGYPGHLSYFNKEGMINLLSYLDFKIHSTVADNPVDLNLLNDNSNYIEDTSKGKNIHFFKVRSDNFLGSLSADKLLQVYEILGSMGVGRNLNYYCSIKT